MKYFRYIQIVCLLMLVMSAYSEMQIINNTDKGIIVLVQPTGLGDSQAHYLNKGQSYIEKACPVRLLAYSEDRKLFGAREIQECRDSFSVIKKENRLEIESK